MKSLKLFSALALLVMSTYGFSQNDNPALPYGAIEVVGEASINVPADYAEIHISANATSRNADEAHKTATAEMAKAIEFLKKQKNISEVKTTRVTLNPRQVGPRNEDIEYFATQSLSFRLNDVAMYDQVMLGLIGIGINGINHVSFQSSEADKFKDVLLKQAMQEARRKAALMAAEYGQEVGRAIHISDRVGGGDPRPMMEFKSASFDMAGPSVEAGEIELSTTVSVQFELK